jgi:hypothetical protein
MVLLGVVWSVIGFQVWALIGAILLLDALHLIRNIRCFRQAEMRRQAAASEDRGYRPLAEDQPLSDAEALAVPIVIIQRPGWLVDALLPLLGGIYAVFFPFIVIPESVLHPSIQFLAASLLLMLVFTIRGFLAYYQRIEIQAEGLTVKSGFRCQTIRWDEVRLFAIDGATVPSERPSSYELSSTTTIVRWHLQSNASPFYHLTPPFGEYNRQMAALLSFIAAKTRLPLYDLRQPKEQTATANPLREG